MQTTLTIPSTRSLEPVELPMDFSRRRSIQLTEEQFQSKDEQMSADEILLIEGPLFNLAESIEQQHLIGDSNVGIDKERGSSNRTSKRQ